MLLLKCFLKGDGKLVPYPLIFTAGMFALLSPCGFPMLPGYVSYYMGSKGSLGKVIPTSIACTLGLVAVFSTIGTIAAIVGNVINQYIPLFELVAGIATVLFGIGMLFEVKLPTFFASLKAPKRRGVIGIFLYGVIYGLATLGCSAPIFFSLLFFAVVSGGILHGITTFAVYACGMGVPIFVTTLLVAKAKELTLKRIVDLTPRLQKISGIALVIIGVYLIAYYFLFSL
jgi:cytochrome c-type biogenesis protein